MDGYLESCPTILVVDDDPVQRALLRAALEQAGFRCEEAADGDEGLERCRRLRPDLVFLDVMMPGRDGFAVCSELRKSTLTDQIPILVVTGLEDIASIEQAFNAGATSFLTKPINYSLVGHNAKYIVRSSRIEREIFSAKKLAEESSAAKSHFLANMSHELRTPLNAILGFSEMIATEILGPISNGSYVNYAWDINASAAHLLEIINDILDMSCIEAGRLKIRRCRCDLSDLCDKAARLVEGRAREDGVTLELAVAEEIPPIHSDELRLRQVLVNLLSNAVKFTPEGGRVELRAGLRAEGELEITVSDTGIGMASDQIDKALALFGQVDSDLNRKHEGTGLGLPLARLITEHLGGSLTLESKPGRGTTVTLVFPRGQIATPACRPADPAVTRAAVA